MLAGNANAIYPDADPDATLLYTDTDFFMRIKPCTLCLGGKLTALKEIMLFYYIIFIYTS